MKQLYKKLCKFDEEYRALSARVINAVISWMQECEMNDYEIDAAHNEFGIYRIYLCEKEKGKPYLLLFGHNEEEYILTPEHTLCYEMLACLLIEIEERLDDIGRYGK